MSFLGMNAAQRRYNRGVILASLAYSVLLVSEQYALRYAHLGPAANYALAVLPALPIIGIFVLIGRYLVEEQDEYVRMLMVRQTLWASGFALSVATVWGFLESFDLAGHVDSYYIVVLWFGGLGLGACINRLTLGDSGRC